MSIKQHGTNCKFAPAEVKTITVTNATIGTFVLTITVGVNSDGTLTTSGCPYGLKLNWNNLQGQAKQVVIQYQ